MNMDAFLFYCATFIVATFFVRLVLINIKVRKYIRTYHRDFWEENVHLFVGGGKGGPNIFQSVKGLDDPEIIVFKKEWDRSVKQLFIAVIASVLIIVAYLALLKN